MNHAPDARARSSGLAPKSAFNAAELARQAAETEQQAAIEAWRELSTERDSLAREAATIERLLASALQDNISPALDPHDVLPKDNWATRHGICTRNKSRKKT